MCDTKGHREVAVPSSPSGAPRGPARQTEVVVVGAGLSGLVAARRLHRAGVGVQVVEARDRVGGRLCTREIRGVPVDLGGQWIGPTQDRVRALADGLGLATFPTFHDGRKLLELGGKVSAHRSDIPSLPPLALLELEVTIRRVQRMAAAVPVAGPFDAPGLAEHDARSVGEWARRHVRSRRVRALLTAAVRVVFGAEPDELSVLHFLAYVNGGGGLLRLIEIADGAQQDRFVGGAMPLAEGLAAELGGRVQLAAPVRRIGGWRGGPVRVHTDAGEILAERAIVAVPPALAGRIDMEPALPAGRDHLTQRFGMGGTVKLFAFYDRPFWREAGWSGEVVADGKPLTVVFDNTFADGTACLLGFVVGAAARTWSDRPESARHGAVLAQLSRWFGPEAGRPLELVEQDWSTEPWTRGCPIGFPPPGLLSSHGAALRAPCGRIHWAGTETADRWMGFMDGAVRAGERAAAEVARLLPTPRSL